MLGDDWSRSSPAGTLEVSRRGSIPPGEDRRGIASDARPGRDVPRAGDAVSRQVRVADTVMTELDAGDLEGLMHEALVEARRGLEAGEVPIGAVVALDGVIVGRGFNQPVTASDPTAHAEIVGLRDAARTLGNYRLPGAVMCVTIEPCLMCVGALVHARIARLVFGAVEPKAGALVSTMRALDHPTLNHRFEVVGGVREEDCRLLLQAFFKERRGRV